MIEKTTVRRAVVEHALRMEARLKEHEDKGGWEECRFRRLIIELEGHVEDLKEALFEQGIEDNIENECADIANYSMMIADNFGRVREEGIDND